MRKTFIETSSFSSSLKEAQKTDPELLLRIQQAILLNPEVGDIIRGAGGARKMRVSEKGRGKSGSYRTVYYDFTREGEVFLIALYKKNEKSTITESEKKIIAALIKELNRL